MIIIGVNTEGKDMITNLKEGVLAAEVKNICNFTEDCPDLCDEPSALYG